MSNERQLVMYQTDKDNEGIFLLLVEHKWKVNSENLIVRQNVTRDFVICFAYKNLTFNPILVKL
jgi:hypothetical protein